MGRNDVSFAVNQLFPGEVAMRQKMIKWTVFVCLAVIIVLQSPASVFAEIERFQVPLDDSPYLGPLDAPITIIEFIDFQ